jgi:uncharacterized protein YjbI with pentapeptide repeats
VAKRAKPPVDVQAAVTVLGRLPLHRAVPRGDFTEAYLAHIRLDVGANLTGAELNQADLASAELIGADLTGARLYRADLTEAYLHGAGLSGAAGLSQEQLDAAFGTMRTELPDDLQRPASWGLSTPLIPPPHTA